MLSVNFFEHFAFIDYNLLISTLFQRTLKQFEKLMKRQAFIDQYKQMPIFRDNLDEFDSSKEVYFKLQI